MSRRQYEVISCQDRMLPAVFEGNLFPVFLHNQ